MRADKETISLLEILGGKVDEGTALTQQGFGMSLYGLNNMKSGVPEVQTQFREGTGLVVGSLRLISTGPTAAV